MSARSSPRFLLTPTLHIARTRTAGLYDVEVETRIRFDPDHTHQLNDLGMQYKAIVTLRSEDGLCNGPGDHLARLGPLLYKGPSFASGDKVLCCRRQVQSNLLDEEAAAQSDHDEVFARVDLFRIVLGLRPILVDQASSRVLIGQTGGGQPAAEAHSHHPPRSPAGQRPGLRHAV